VLLSLDVRIAAVISLSTVFRREKITVRFENRENRENSQGASSGDTRGISHVSASKYVVLSHER
jgi:hypothetical protein